jgi:hypothetical protein
VDPRAEELVEGLVRPLVPGERPRAGEHEMDGKPGSRAGGGGEPAMVRPAPTRRDQRVRALRQRGTDEELQVPELVPAECERQEILALEPDLGPGAGRGPCPERRAQAVRGQERRRRVEQPEPGQRGDRGWDVHRRDPIRC